MFLERKKTFSLPTSGPIDRFPQEEVDLKKDLSPPGVSLRRRFAP